jgi:hypothetical protein
LGLRPPLNPRRNSLLGIKVARVGILPTARLRTVVLNPTPYPSLLGLLKSNLLQHHLKLFNVLIALILKILLIHTSKLDAILNLLLMSLIITDLVPRLSCTTVWVKEHKTNRAGMQSNLHLAPITISHLANLQNTIHIHIRVTAMDHATLTILNKDPRRKTVCHQFGYKNVV